MLTLCLVAEGYEGILGVYDSVLQRISTDGGDEGTIFEKLFLEPRLVGGAKILLGARDYIERRTGSGGELEHSHLAGHLLVPTQVSLGSVKLSPPLLILLTWMARR